jgi:hypothetical protein
MDMLIRGKVARILTSRQLVINVGSENGVEIGMKFDVLDPKGDDIKDPDTGEILGSVNRPKVRVEIIEVQNRLSVAQTYKKRTVNIGGSGGFIGSTISDMLKPPKYIETYETLKTTEQTWENISESESYVKTGDPVVQVADR